MTDDLRALLESVAQGRIAPARAAQLLDDLPSDPDQPAAQPAGVEARPRLVRVTASARPVRLVADHTVDTVTVEGPHSVRRDGDTIRVDATPLGGSDVDRVDRADRAAWAAWAGSYRYERKTGFARWLGQTSLVGVPLTVRVNPSMAADVEVMAGSLEIVGLSGPVAFSVTAGSMRAQDCTGTFNGSVRAGSAKLDIRPTSGRSLVRVESGSLDLRLQAGSDVRVTGRADLGEIKVRAADGSQHVVNREELRDVVVGSGAATFELEVAMGSAKVRLP